MMIIKTDAITISTIKGTVRRNAGVKISEVEYLHTDKTVKEDLIRALVYICASPMELEDIKEACRRRGYVFGSNDHEED